MQANKKTAGQGGQGKNINAGTLPLSSAGDNGRAEGRRRKDHALSELEKRRKFHLLKARRALVLALLDDGEADADAVFEAVHLEIPDDLDPRFLGAVPSPLAHAGIIESAGYVTSKRPERHASVFKRWRLADRSKATAWLSDNPAPSPIAAAPIPNSLFDAAVGAEGVR